jgi:hypothetical protein
MRETVPLISSYRRRELPASLMQRIEMMQQLALVVQPGSPAPLRRAPVGQAPPRRVRRSAHAAVLAWFSLGVIASGVAGAGAVVGMRTLFAGAPPGAAAPAVTSWSQHPRTEWDTVSMVIDRSQRMRTPLPLQVTGAEDTFEIVVHGLPQGVRPSRGAPVGEGTWVLKPTELDGLYLMLESAVPDAFDVKIAVLTPSSGMATAGSIVQVRLVEMAPVTQAAVTVGAPAPAAPLAYAGMSDGSGSDVARTASASTLAAARTGAGRGGDKAASHQPAHRRIAPAAAGVTAPSGQSANAGKTWPEGAYGLGATSREPEQPTSWWQMPPPAWSPFLVGQEPP